MTQQYASWGYGLTRYTLVAKTTGSSVHVRQVYAVRELYYDSDGNVAAWSDEPIAPLGEDAEELVTELERMVDAATRGRVFDLDTRTWEDQAYHMDVPAMLAAEAKAAEATRHEPLPAGAVGTRPNSDGGPPPKIVSVRFTGDQHARLAAAAARAGVSVSTYTGQLVLHALGPDEEPPAGEWKPQADPTRTTRYW